MTVVVHKQLRLYIKFAWPDFLGHAVIFADNSIEADMLRTQGAGDTFGGSFVAARAMGHDVRVAACFANAAASVCVGGLGARAGAVAWEVVAERMQMK